MQTITIALEPADVNLIFLVPDTGKKIKRNKSFFLLHVKMIYQLQEEENYPK